MNKLFWKYAILLIVIVQISCVGKKQDEPVDRYVISTNVVQPDWSKNAVIYEVNIRQHTAEGTINAFMQDMPRLKELGV